MTHDITTEAHGWLTPRLERASQGTFVLFAIAASFSTYFCMYAFRKPFAAGTYEGLTFLGSDVTLKTALVLSQLVGYTLSKFLGIKVCSEATRAVRARWLLGLVVAAELALVAFALLPLPWKPVAMLLNGLPLGMVWGLVVWYLEGRRSSELLLAGLSCSFILASGVVKDVGVALIATFGITEWWMPAAVGAIFLPVFALSVWLLNQIPSPSLADRASRHEREPMNAEERNRFVRQFLPGLAMLFIVYFFLTAFRDFRDNYGREIFESVGLGDDLMAFSKSEGLVTLGVLVTLAALNLVRDNRLGLIGAYVVMLVGSAMMGIGTWLYRTDAIGGFAWMVSAGLGGYLAYVPYGSVLFERIMAHTRVQGTAVFAIYLADSLGYSGSVVVQLFKDLGRSGASRLEFLVGFTYFMSILGCVLLAASCVYFLWRARQLAPVEDDGALGGEAQGLAPAP